MSADQPQREMPKYRCHKEVWALRINKVAALDDGGARITPEEQDYAPFEVSEDWLQRATTKGPDFLVGGFYVVYADGYKSWSPEKAFMDGYTRI